MAGLEIASGASREPCPPTNRRTHGSAEGHAAESVDRVGTLGGTLVDGTIGEQALAKRRCKRGFRI